MMFLKLLLALLMMLSINLRSSEATCYNVFYKSEVEALQTILGAWNESTPDMMTNLAGWSSSQIFPCYTNQSWRGVICSFYPDNITHPCNYTINIVVLHLTAASINGTLPSAIGNLTRLVELTLTDNPGLSGNIPPELGNLENLVILNLSNNDLNGSIPAELFRSNRSANSSAYRQSSLQQIDLSNNRLSGNVPNLGGANWLQSVKISNNKLTGPSPPFYDPGTGYGFVNMTELNTIDLSENELVGSPPNLTAIWRLQSVNLSSNYFNGSIIPTSIFNTSANLTVLDLSHNNFTGLLPDLSTFSNSLTQFIKMLIDELLILICFRDLSNNQFSGNLPNLGGASWLQTVQISNNKLTGPSPRFYDPGTGYGFVNMTELNTMNLSSNYFNGSIIPTSIFNTSANLAVLDLSLNNFTGLLPDLSTFSNSLTQLNLSFNSFNPEPYPAWVKGFNQLSMLSLKRNGLSGPFPYDLASLPNLEIL
ncbi:unnamed protein product [Sphagnum jensenii]|uniref:Leucine-rich repeat-containing N-terminal plant-type domain-containing protein n=1 Tax=Sphagnum jensenii TaxID=128206 RepID=A0ABP0WE97_9BRYO